jgi:hypothetical protein
MYGFSIFWERIYLIAGQSAGAVSSRAIIDYDRRLDLKPFPGEKNREKLKMTKARLDGLYFLLIGSVVFLFLSAVLQNASAPTIDFRGLYYPARCLLQHCDPYREGEVLRFYQAAGADSSVDSVTAIHSHFLRNPYPPTAFSLTVPFAMLPWEPARVLWMMLTVSSLILASFLAWDLGADDAPILSGAMIGFLIVNVEAIMILGNAAGILVSLCAVAVWCFLRERFIPAGILCLAVSLAVKPQNAGLVWLYFFLAGGAYRKRAWQTLLATIAIGLPTVLWVWHVVPHWIEEWHSNALPALNVTGLTDPGLAPTGGHGPFMVMDLQVVFNFFWNDPRIYNSAAYLVCAPLLLVWAIVTLRSRPSPTRARLALAAIVPLSLLPVYHRLYDAKLLLLTVPACAMLWAGGGLAGRLALLVNAGAFVLTGDLLWSVFYAFITTLHLPAAGLPGRMLMAAQVFPAPLILLVMAIFYLWVYARCCSAPAASAESGSNREAPISSPQLDPATDLKNHSTV